MWTGPNHTLGIGINLSEIGLVYYSETDKPLKKTRVKNPSGCIGFGDAGAVTLATKNLSPDEWLPDIAFDAASGAYTGGGATYFRSPSDALYPAGSERAIPRHAKRANFLLMDTHAETMRNSRAGWTLPRVNEGALWARDHATPWLTP